MSVSRVLCRMAAGLWTGVLVPRAVDAYERTGTLPIGVAQSCLSQQLLPWVSCRRSLASKLSLLQF